MDINITLFLWDSRRAVLFIGKENSGFENISAYLYSNIGYRMQIKMLLPLNKLGKGIINVLV